MSCPAKHALPETSFQWCPQCEKAEMLRELALPADATCPRLHARDVLRCVCGYETTGKKLALRHARREGMQPCAVCKGAGFVLPTNAMVTIAAASAVAVLKERRSFWWRLGIALKYLFNKL